MSIRNRVSLIGRTGSEVEILNFEKGGVKASVSLATNEHYTTTGGEKVEETQWHNLIAFGKTAELLEKYVFKGKEIAVEGKIQYRSFENAEGQKKSVTEVRVNEVILLS